MASSTTKGLPFPEYFSALAANYAQQTGNSTNRIFALSLPDIEAVSPLTKDSIVHDNAAGPGTATAAIVEKFPREKVPSILITDNVPPMVEAAKATFVSWPQIETRVLDSLSLDGIPDDQLTHSILNFSIFTFSDPVKGLREIYRTLRPGGVAALTTWKRFGASQVIHAAQALVRPDLPPMALPHPEFLQQGVLEKTAVEAGFARDAIQVKEESIVVSGLELDEGLKKFILGDFTRPARQGWSDEEVGRWPDAVEQAIQEEIEAFGGIKFEAWVVITKK